MKIKRSITTLSVVAFASILGVGTGIAVYAQDGTNMDRTNTTTPNSSESTSTTTERTAEQQKLEAAKEAETKARTEAEQEIQVAKDKVKTAEDRLSGTRLKTCQARQAAITKIMKDAAQHGTDQITLFSTITTRVENFYKSKGKTLSNYDQLVSDVTAKQTAAQAAVQTVKTADTQFDCSSANPKATIDVFKAEIKAQNTAIEQYRTAVKNLIVGIKSVQSTTSTGNGA
ncbi:MAG TPA: hypothetical protein VLG36_01675 [Candidatus Chromulinivoraceae bacterium]|nr:hypothetical protein [Candidatus Chromulinivoraceae bacterium]